MIVLDGVFDVVVLTVILEYTIYKTTLSRAAAAAS